MPEGPSGPWGPPDRSSVLHLLGPSTGGIRRHVACLTTHLRRRGWDVAVAGPRGVLDGLGVLDHEVEVPSGRPSMATLSARAGVAALVAKADVVHAHGLKAGWLVASLRRRPPLVVTVHNLVLAEASGAATPLLRALEGRLAARAERLLAPSDEVARRFTGLAGAGRTTVVAPVWPSPMVHRSADEVRRQWGVAPGVALLVTVARLHPQKGIDVLLDAVHRLRRRSARLHCLVLGEGPVEDDLRRQVARLDLTDTVTLGGGRASAADELAAADVVVVPSRWESGPLVAFEALQLGRPLVSTAVGVVPDLVVDGESGYLVPAGDDVALAGAVQAVLDDPAAAASVAEAGRRAMAARFDEDTLVSRVEDVYRELLGRRPDEDGEAGA